MANIFLFVSLVFLFSCSQNKSSLKTYNLSVAADKHMLDVLANIPQDQLAGVDYENNTLQILSRQTPSFEGLLIEDVYEVDSEVDSGYTTPSQLQTKLEAINAAHPTITLLTEIGKSYENRPIWALKITEAPMLQDPTKPAILFNSMHHAREVMTTEVALDIIEYLVANYQKDEKVTKWVSQNQIWVVPMLNPDGNNKVWNGSKMWRKNTAYGHGVDLNRNYPFQWGRCNGSSGSKNSDTYRGPSAGSEPETKALMNLVANIKPVFDISFHSYSELVIYPLSCSGERVPAPHRDIVEGIGKEMASKIERDNGRMGYTAGTSWQTLYSVDGGDIDWMYNEHQVIPYVIELNSSSQGFHPSFARWRQPTIERARASWQFLLEKLDDTSIRGINFFNDLDDLVTVSNKQKNWVYTPKVNADGTFHAVLLPGEYEVKIGGLTLDVSVNGKMVVINANDFL
jgi:carboxypeptidase T